MITSTNKKYKIVVQVLPEVAVRKYCDTVSEYGITIFAKTLPSVAVLRMFVKSAKTF